MTARAYLAPAACRQGANAVPGHVAGFSFPDRDPSMTNINPTKGRPRPEDGDVNKRSDGIDANPTCRIGKAVRFRKLLAELIARRILAARGGQPGAGREPKR
jgi:hypothetical protein